MDPLPPPTVLRKSSTSSPSNMMETSIDEGIETEEPDAEEDPPHLLSAYQTARFGQRRHTLSEVTNQPGPSNQGKFFTLGHNPSMGSVDSDMGYDMGSMHSDIGLLEDPPSLSELVSSSTSTQTVTPSPFLSARPPNPAMAALTSQHRETHNRSPISFREGRRASDTSLTQGLVAFRQHLQNLARTKGILELNKVQMLVEHMGSREVAAMSPVGPQHHLHNLLEGEASKQQEDLTLYQGGPHPPLLSRRQSLETQYLTHRLQANVLANSPASCQLFCKEAPSKFRAAAAGTQTKPEEDVPAAVPGYGTAGPFQSDADSRRLLPSGQFSSGARGVSEFSGSRHVSHPPASGPAADHSPGLAALHSHPQPEPSDGTR
ncbi:hypothetical protein fugu_011221 [Takifugu bimaculatus]|uniref:Uncharacterized protein n=1 Tax=Takifugu bimaculatus TaxID=433685 RepID=A0A4Z2CCC3_9TELE|nr:hypothetical protein fugu_011221 [Takifugu bimaculatus]